MGWGSEDSAVRCEGGEAVVRCEGGEAVVRCVGGEVCGVGRRQCSDLVK